MTETFEDCAETVFEVSYRVAFRLTGVRADAEDIAQEICARAFLRWSRVSPYFEAWAARCAANLALDLLRTRHRPGSSTGDSIPPTDVDRIDLARAIRGLPRRQRDVVVLRYVADLSERDVADRLGCSVGAVKQHAHRALLSLRSSVQLGFIEGAGGDV